MLAYRKISKSVFSGLIKKFRTYNADVQRCMSSSKDQLKSEYDVVIIGGGHNGLVSASYLQRSGLSVCVLERRHIIGGAAVTEEIVPGFKFSRASYVIGLLEQKICQDLELKKYGMKIYPRNPNAYTPIKGAVKGKDAITSLTLGSDPRKNYEQISQFSKKDAEAYSKFDEFLGDIAKAIRPLIEHPPPNLKQIFETSSLSGLYKAFHEVKPVAKSVKRLGRDFGSFYDLLTAPATKILDYWFESDILKALLGTDAVIGTQLSPKQPGTGYVLLHHVMGCLDGNDGQWGYAEGGNGAVSRAIADSALDHGAHVFTNKKVTSILQDSNNRSSGVLLDDGVEIKSKFVLSNATAKVTFLDLAQKGSLPDAFTKRIRNIDYRSPVTKINVAVDKIPNFLADPNIKENEPMPHHQCTIHLNSENIESIHDAYLESENGFPSKKPLIEMTIPSSLDPTISPQGKHVVLLFTQYTPYHINGGREWTTEDKNAYCDTVFDSIEEYAPGFKASVIGKDILTPPDLESVFGLTGGNIFHGALSLDQLYFSRPVESCVAPYTPIKGLYLCGAGGHPGGGVMGIPGRLAAEAVIRDSKTLK